MRSAFLDDADPEALSKAIRDVLERRGALVVEHRHSRVRFTGPPAERSPAWTRAGYAGIYQHLGEREAEVRLLLRAKWPWRILWGVAFVNVLVVIATFAINPSGTAWSILAIVTGFALLAAALVYVGTFKSVRADEKRLMEEFEAEFERDLPEAEVESEEERELRALEAELEGEIAQKQIARSRAASTGKRFSLRPSRGGAAAPEAQVEESPEERRARLLARKAELEARLREPREPEP